uniref:(northern house mosquito) hypothetical protein n=2 Tax=Culex pipiens TaxID=7175 RepID=A0A8D8GIG6_CULPI
MCFRLPRNGRPFNLLFLANARRQQTHGTALTPSATNLLLCFMASLSTLVKTNDPVMQLDRLLPIWRVSLWIRPATPRPAPSPVDRIIFPQLVAIAIRLYRYLLENCNHRLRGCQSSSQCLGPATRSTKVQFGAKIPFVLDDPFHPWCSALQQFGRRDEIQHFPTKSWVILSYSILVTDCI